MRLRPNRRMLPLALVGLGVSVVVVFVVVVIFMSWFSNPPFGLGNAPPQPVAFPHTVHVAQQGIQCEFCHRNVTVGAAATVPAVEQCMFCHRQVSGSTDEQRTEITKVSQSFADNTPINWERVHRLPDHVRFVHEAHVRFFTQDLTEKHLLDGPTQTQALTVEQTCSMCHGDVRNMEVVKPKAHQSMKMGTCLDCHRENNAPTDCTVCHK